MTLTVASAAFLEGYGLARTHEQLAAERLLRDLCALEHERTPFAFEGAGMALRLLDERDKAARRVAAFRASSDSRWHPFLDLGVGCARARLGLSPPEDGAELDGYGFYRGLIAGAWSTTLLACAPRMERGLGRAAWFSTGGDAFACAGLLCRNEHPNERWRGVGTACAFAGDPKGHASELMKQGVQFALELRAGAAEALRLWISFGGEPPLRVLEVVNAFGANRTNPPPARGHLTP